VPLGDLPALLAACRACVSVDTGPAHIAAAVGCPLLTIFGPSDPARFAPRGPGRSALLVGSAPCQFCLGTPRFRTCRANVCLTGVSDLALRQAFDGLVAA
jgi:ADP-heptose:LPS heptosyltransferase